MEYNEMFVSLVEMTSGIDGAIKDRLEAVQKLHNPPEHVEVTHEEARRVMREKHFPGFKEAPCKAS